MPEANETGADPGSANPASPAAPAPTPPRQSYSSVWSAAALEIIQALSGDTQWAPLSPEAADPAAAEVEMVAFIEFSGALAGIQQIKLHRGQARAWAQLLMPPAPDAPNSRSSALDDAERDVLSDVMRRILAAAAASLPAAGYGESAVELRHLGPLRRTMESSDGAEVLAFGHPGGKRLEFSMTLDASLRDKILAATNPTLRSRTPLGERAPMTSTTRFDMLLDVELDVTLRFGNRQMLLHDVAELVPGSVLELDRQIDDPVELLVGGKIIAWGEVVVVDGNYGLRVNRLVQRSERIAALEAAR